MPIISISEAARLAGCNRKTITRWIAKGKLSTSQDTDGTMGVEISELQRAFGQLSQDRDTPRNGVMSQRVREKSPVSYPIGVDAIATKDAVIEGLKAALALKDALIEEKDKRLEEKDRHIQNIEKAMFLLGHDKGQEDISPIPTTSPWWKFWK